MIDKSCAILNEISIKASLSLTNTLLNMSLVLSHQSLYQSQSTSLSNTNINTNTKRRRIKTSQAEGGAVLCSFIDWFLLLLVARCLLAWCLSRVSCLVCERASYLHLFGLSSLELGSSLCRREREREREREMDDNPLDRDARIKLSIGTKQQGDADGTFSFTGSLAFDHHRGLLLVVDTNNNRVQVFSCDDGSFVSKFGEKGDQPGQFQYPDGLAIDHDHDRILITDRGNNRVQSWSLSEQSLLPCIGHPELLDVNMFCPRSIAIDKHHRRIIIVDDFNHRLVFLSSIDLSFLFSIGIKGSQPGEFCCPSSIAIDDDRHRIIVADRDNHRVQVLSSIDGSFLFEFGSKGDQLFQFKLPHGVCIANQGRIIVADFNHNRLQSFTHEGRHISSFDCGSEKPWAIAFDEHRGLIAFTAGHRVHVIGANQWLADTSFTWRPDHHRYAPSWMKQAISTMTMIRSLVDDSAMSMIPNELLFEIFSHL